MITTSIVTYKTDRIDLEKALACICKSQFISKVYVVDNSPTDELQFTIQFSEKIEYIFGQGNVGYGSAHNLAIKRAINLGAQYHIVMNPDVFFETKVIDSLLNYMNMNSDVGQVMPKVIYPNGNIQYLCKLIPTPMDLIFKRFLPSSIKKKRMEKFQLRFTGYTDFMNIPYLSGCFMFFRVDALKKVGLFDERFFMYPEDIDITRRMHKFYKTMYHPHVTIIHAHAADSYKNKKMFKIHILNMIKYFNKWGWFYDRERECVNKKILDELGYKKSQQ